jgi:hypothetical protein
MKPDRLLDWRDKSLYPDPSVTTLQQWAWQFLRRNSEYRRLWKEIVEPEYDPKEAAESVKQLKKRAGLFPFMFWQYFFRFPEFRIFVDQFKIVSTPPNPAESNANPVFLGNVLRYGLKSPSRYDKVHPELDDSEVLVLFDSNQRIEPQLTAVKELLKKRAAATNNIKFRATPKTYQKYLRLLDAKEARATSTQIAKEIYPHLKNDYTRGRHGERQVRADFVVAKRLRDRDFWRIAAAG